MCSLHGYTNEHTIEMMKLLRETRMKKILRDCGIVIAVNTRLLVKNMGPFEEILNSYPRAQLLCWVGTGEPKISISKVKKIQQHFKCIGIEGRVGFDVQVWAPK